MMEGSWTGRKKGNDLGLRLQCQQSCLGRAPVIHLLKNETMLGIWYDWSQARSTASWCPGARLSEPPAPKGGS